MASAPIVNLSSEDLQRLGLQELRQLCKDVGINSSAFLEKRDFFDALLPFVADASADAVRPDAFHANLQRATAAGPLKLVFLDVDGVLNTTPRGTHSSAVSSANLDSACVGRLAELLRDSRTYVVLSTSWRSSVELKLQLFKALTSAGMPDTCIVGQTPHISFRDRATEICDWLKLLPEGSLGSWAVLDDMDLSEANELAGHFVWVDDEFGLSDENLIQLRGILGLQLPLRET